MIEDDGGKTGESGSSTRATSIEPQTETVSPLSFHHRDDLKTLDCLDAPTTLDPPVESLDWPIPSDVALPQHPVQTEDKAEEEEASTEPNLTPGRERSGKLTSARAETQTLGDAAVSNHDDTDDDDDDIRPPSKKRTAGKPLVPQNEAPDSIIPKAGHADAPSLKGARNHQPRSKASPSRHKRASGQSKPAHMESQQWEIRKVISKRRTRRGWEYKVGWANSWLPRSELENASRLVREFESKDSAQQKSRHGRSGRDSSSED